MRYDLKSAREFAIRVCVASGASKAVAISLAEATVAAECSGRNSVGFAHLPDYLDGFLDGRIASTEEPVLFFPAPALIQVDAKGGIAQLGFDRAFEELQTRASTYGVTVFALKNSYTAGELGYYVRRLAHKGLVALAATNGSALMAAGHSSEAVYGTNPLSFAAPVDNRAPLVIDQASSATAFVNIRQAAERGEMIPEGWAIDENGQSTMDSREAIKGALLAFGGARGANIALMVEILAAGTTGANWSLDAPSFEEGSHSPGVGLFIVAINPELLAPDFSARIADQIERLSSKGIHVPGGSFVKEEIDLPSSLVATLEKYC
ncbi:Ldh family oxidoreductase [Paenibacillus sp. JCM 10914]|uniref:Ldh family oxidoreductase n=1 Tax=Paenibacillus sp. JCM 10914 TaxID=1236974 RepID=UPI0003CCB5BD|nr:Ldh family oxidoreductase [Paenibacillus sp. JCM 10914]GAE06244.1 malate dehydrogenase [Paenibacillus sp. JCM 10914]